MRISQRARTPVFTNQRAHATEDEGAFRGPLSRGDVLFPNIQAVANDPIAGRFLAENRHLQVISIQSVADTEVDHRTASSGTEAMPVVLASFQSCRAEKGHDGRLGNRATGMSAARAVFHPLLTVALNPHSVIDSAMASGSVTWGSKVTTASASS